MAEESKLAAAEEESKLAAAAEMEVKQERMERT